MKRLSAIHNSKDWQDQLSLAHNKLPGTAFDDVFQRADLALVVIRKNPSEGKAQLERVGLYFAELFQRRDGGQVLHDMAKALNGWHSHEPRLALTDYVRISLIGLHAMFPPVSVRDVIESLKRKGISVNSRNGLRREIQKQAVKLKIPLNGKPGRPRKSKPDKKQ